MKKFISFSKPRLGSPPTKYHFPRRSRYLRRFSIAHGADHGVFGGKAHTLKQKKTAKSRRYFYRFFFRFN